MKHNLYQETHCRRDPLMDRDVTVVPHEMAEIRRLIQSWHTTGDSQWTSTDWCDFCNHNTTRIIDSIATPGGQVYATTRRHTDFSVFRKVVRLGDGFYDLSSGYGTKERIVISNDHFIRLSNVEPALLQASLLLCQRRITDLRRDSHLKHIIISTDGNNMAKQHGYVHPTWSIWAKFDVFQRAKEEIKCLARHWKFKDERCLICDIVREERSDRNKGKRLLYASDAFTAITPFASRHPFEIHLYPTKHAAYFENMDQDMLPELVKILQTFLIKLELLLGNRFRYSLALHNAPISFPGYKPELIKLQYHWFFRLKPYITNRSIQADVIGEETNHLTPELAAQLLNMDNQEIISWLQQ